MKYPEKTDLPGIKQIKKAYRQIREHIHQTPLMSSKFINSLSGSDIVFKCENFQKGGAFKIRGALYNVFSNLKEHQKYGITTHSSGNHAQAVALAGSMAGIKVHVVMPENAPEVKTEAVRSYGGIITFCKPTLKDREKTMDELIAEYGYKPIHAYNDIRTITGQGTVSLEILEQLNYKPDYLITPVGGGGLLSGTSLTCGYISPGTKVIGSEPANANDAYLSFRKKQFVPSVSPNTIADGLKTSLGSLTFPIIIDKVADIMIVSEDSIINAMKLIWERMKIIVEPSAAVGLAVVLDNPEVFKDKTVSIVLTGGNVDLKGLIDNFLLNK